MYIGNPDQAPAPGHWHRQLQEGGQAGRRQGDVGEAEQGGEGDEDLLSSDSSILFLLGSSDPCSPDQQLQLGPEQDSLPLPAVPSGVHLQGQS